MILLSTAERQCMHGLVRFGQLPTFLSVLTLLDLGVCSVFCTVNSDMSPPCGLEQWTCLLLVAVGHVA